MIVTIQVHGYNRNNKLIMAGLKVEISDFTMKMIKEAHVFGYMQCAEEHGLLESIDTDLNCLGIATTDEPDED